MTVRELLSRIDSAELSEWLAYHSLEPLPDPHHSAALIAATTANVMGSGKKRYAPSDFMPQREAAKPQSISGQLARMKMFAALHNADIKE